MHFMTRICFVLLTAICIFPHLCRSQSATSQECDPNKLARAREFFGNSDYPQAETLLRPLENCPSAIGGEAKQLLAKIADSRNCSPIRIQALAAQNRGNHDGACGFLAEIEKTCPNWDRLSGLKRLIGDCRKALTPEEDFNQALDLRKKCDWNGAIALLGQIKEKNPSFPGLTNEISSVQKDIEEVKSATDLRNAGRLEEARAILSRVKSRAGPSCQTLDAASEDIRRDIDDIKKASDFCSRGNSQESLLTLEKVKERNPSYNWLNREIVGVRGGSKCASSMPAPQNTFADLLVKGQAALRSKDYFNAADLLERALEIHPRDVNAKMLLAQANRLAQSQREAMRDALRSYYLGDYAEAGKLLQNILSSGEASPQSKTLAKFYLGASLLSTYYLSGENKRDLASEALVYFGQVQAEAPKFAPPSTGISKRIVEQFNAVKQQNP